jgi:hypothetical protein
VPGPLPEKKLFPIFQRKTIPRAPAEVVDKALEYAVGDHIAAEGVSVGIPEPNASKTPSQPCSPSTPTVSNLRGGLGAVAPEPKLTEVLFPIFYGKLAPMLESEEPGQLSAPATTEDKTPPDDAIQDFVGPERATTLRQTRSPSVSVVPGPSKLVEAGSSRDAPIVLESPICERVKPLPTTARPAKPVYSIFSRPARNAAASTSKLGSGPCAAHPTRETQPTPEWSTFPSVPARFSSRDKGKAREVDSLYDTLDDSLPRLGPTSSYPSDSQPNRALSTHISVDVHDYITTIPQSHQCIPSISRLLQAASEDTVPRAHADAANSSQEQWMDKWRPRQADHVLANEQHALYLRDWLQALRLQGSSTRPSTLDSSKQGRKAQNRKRKAGTRTRPAVVRHVKRRKRDSRADDFFAPDDWDDDDDVMDDSNYEYYYGGAGASSDAQSSDWDDFGFMIEQDARMHGTTAGSTDVSRGSSPINGLGIDVGSYEGYSSAAYRPTRFGRQISNTILLAGPPGAGKTAAVYACAAELGWEVFEVYPGIGERSGAELNKLVGDVGKNHTVKVQPPPRKAAAKAGFFQKRKEKAEEKKTKKVIELDEDEVDLVMDDDGDVVVDIVSVEQPDVGSEPTEPSVNQSVILIEEADVLYQTDTNFWPALINIIKLCRRPVVLTCNG